jgi:ATP-binding cassette subfamily B protein
MSIAGVVFKDPKILILDEATSSLDSISESHIQDALDALMKGRTSIVIAHRLSTVLAADQILVLTDGEIKERGRHDELMAMHGIYRELFETQFRRAIDLHNEGRQLICAARPQKRGRPRSMGAAFVLPIRWQITGLR